MIWLQSLPEDVQAWVRESTDFPDFISALYGIVLVAQKDNKEDPTLDDAKTQGEMYLRLSVVLARMLFLHRTYRILTELVATGEGEIFPAAGWDVYGRFGPDAQGRLRYLPTLHEQWLRDTFEGVEGARIRRCVICSEFFWAGRLDQAACSPKCASVRRVRDYREKQQTKKRRQSNEDD